MANTAIMIRRNGPGEGSATQSVDLLASDGTNYWLWSVRGIDPGLTDAQVQAYLDAEADNIMAAIIANNEVPLTPEQLDAYRTLIDATKADVHINKMDAAVALINVSTITETDLDGIPNAPTGLLDAFRSAAFNALSDAAQRALIRAAIFELLDIELSLARAVRLTLKWMKLSATNSINALGNNQDV